MSLFIPINVILIRSFGAYYHSHVVLRTVNADLNIILVKWFLITVN